MLDVVLVSIVRGHGSNECEMPPVMPQSRSKDMIVKPSQSSTLPSDPKLRAGIEAERQLAFYLHRDFAGDADVLVLNDLRFVDLEQPEHDGKPGV